METYNQTIHYPDKAEIDQLYKLINVADYDPSSRRELLRRLKFINKKKSISIEKWRYYCIEKLDEFLDPIIVVFLILFSSLIFRRADWVRIIFLVLAFLIAYIHWLKSQRSKNVEDAMARKDKANSMIIEHADLLYPYIGNVFDFKYRYIEKQIDDIKRTKINMYVFTEIDNLEFVFEKSRSGLIEDNYIVRAIKIFVTRSENAGFFRTARKLIISGRYNEDFTHAAKHLLYVGHLCSSQFKR